MAQHPEDAARASRVRADTSEHSRASTGEVGHLGALVSTNWVWLNHSAPGVRVLEVGYDTAGHDVSHIPGSVGVSWGAHVNKALLEPVELEQLMSRLGVHNSDTVVLYGDSRNIYALHLFWLLKFHGHTDVRIMNGGRQKWLIEQEKPMTADRPRALPYSRYRAGQTATYVVAPSPPVHSSTRVRVMLDSQVGSDVQPSDVILHLDELIHPGDGTFAGTPQLQAALSHPPGSLLTLTSPSPPAAAAAWFAARYLCGFERAVVSIDR
jgi:hypothetical protein